MWCHATWYIGINISVECAASIFQVGGIGKDNSSHTGTIILSTVNTSSLIKF
jgi:hypothetical protein